MVVVAIPYIPSHVSVKTDNTRRWSLLLLLSRHSNSLLLLLLLFLLLLQSTMTRRMVHGSKNVPIYERIQPAVLRFLRPTLSPHSLRLRQVVALALAVVPVLHALVVRAREVDEWYWPPLQKDISRANHRSREYCRQTTKGRLSISWTNVSQRQCYRRASDRQHGCHGRHLYYYYYCRCRCHQRGCNPILSLKRDYC